MALRPEQRVLWAYGGWTEKFPVGTRRQKEMDVFPSGAWVDWSLSRVTEK